MKLKKIANVILTAILLFSSTQLTLKIIDYKKSEKLYSEIQNVVDSTENNSNSDSDNTSIETYQKLHDINSDYKFWVEVENTNISYPVVQTTNNSFYLKKDFNKNNSNSGTIFMDAMNDFNKDNNVVLYGHNMKNKTMFNNVTLFKKQDFFNQNNKIKIKHTEDEKEYVFEVFSAYYTNNSFNYNTVVFNESYSFMDYIEDIKKKSIYKKDMDISETDKILTLSTCSYEFKGAKTTVHAKLIDTIYLNPATKREEEMRKEKEEQERLELEEQKRLEELENFSNQELFKDNDLEISDDFIYYEE